MTKQSIAISPSMSEYFKDAVSGVVRARHVDATDAALTYLVGLLCDYAHPEQNAESTLSKPLTFLLNDAMAANGIDRFKRLRSLGDGVLYAVGFFGDHVDQKRLDRSYMLSVGSSAYDHASAMLRSGSSPRPDAVSQGPDVLAELSIKFERFVEVLADVADGTIASSAHDERSVVKLYERWMRSGSTRLAQELGTRGIVPTRGAGGVH
jgi:hypothetical protein